MIATSAVRNLSCVLLLGSAALASVSDAGAQVAIKRTASGFNLFSAAQDVEVGEAAAAELANQLHPVRSERLQQFLANVTATLSARAPSTKLAFSTTAVTSSATNVFVLPGGRIYISRGLLGLAKSEGEVAGLVAHAMAHAILRHGTEQTSRAYLERAGIGALGGWGAGERTADRMVKVAGGFGLRAAFLSFGLADEYEADALGTDLMASAGYDPIAMAALFGTLRREQARNTTLATFSRSHPAPDDREYRIRNLANVLGHGRSEVVGGFSAVRVRGNAGNTVTAPAINESPGSIDPAPSPVSLSAPRPSTKFVRFSHPDSILSIEHPDNWAVYPSGVAVSFAPEGGVIERKNGEPRMVLGMVLNYYAPFENAVARWNHSLKRSYAPFDRTRPRGTLEDATDDLVRQIIAINPWLSAPNKSAESETLDGAPGYSVRLRGKSTVTGQVERVTLFTRLLPDDDVVYVACVTPATFAVAMERACTRMARSLRLNDAAVHRTY